MAVDPSVRIDLAVEYKGKKAFDQADRATQKLTNNVKKLAGAFGLAFSTRAIVNFAKESVKAFAEDDAAIIVLRKNLQNLGLAYESTNAETFISNLEKQAGILDDVLRPAYSQLAKVTLSAAKTQELMNLAVDLSRSTGVEFSSVINTLSRAYIGNYKGLKQLNIGLTDAELKTKDFAEVQAILIKQSKGAGKAYIETYAGSIDKLSVAAANAKEIIGEGLVDLFADLAGNGDIDKATDNILGLAEAFSQLLKDADKFGLLDYVALFVTGSITKETFDKLNVKPGGGFTDSQNAARLAAEKKAAADAKKAAAAAKALAAAKAAADRKALANEKAKAALSKAAANFDLNKIQIAAALKATYDKDERLRLLAMQEIENDNGEKALDYLKQLRLLTDEQYTNKLAGINSIAETELREINKLLFAELKRIETTEMSEKAAAEARAEAYRKYNAAIIASGGLAEANFYSEKTQIDLLKIAKLSALEDSATAQATYDLLNYNTQTDIIARIAAAQKLADDAKYKALQDYLALLGQGAGTAAVGGAGGGAAAAAVTGGAKLEIAGLEPPKFLPNGQPVWSWQSGYDSMTSGTGGANIDNSVTVVVEGNILDGDDFTDKMNRAMLDSIRRGLSQLPAGALP